MNPFAKVYWIGKGVGWENIPRRIWQAYVMRTGLLKRKLSPTAYSADRFELSTDSGTEQLRRWSKRKKRFLVAPTSEMLAEVASQDVWESDVTAKCKNALRGNYQFFSKWHGQLGWPPNFNLDPVNNIDWPISKTWLGVARSGPPRDDIKLVWEASRLSVAFMFARQYQRSKDLQWSEAFWQLLDAWIEQNPVNQSVAWACGQEVSFRTMAILFAAMTLLDTTNASPQRLRNLELLMWQSGKRIEANINYALSQKNNHGISEAVGLWTIGTLFPEFSESERWLRKGKQISEKEVARQVYEDGSFVQHSLWYHRVMLDDLCWFKALSNSSGQNLSEAFEARARSAISWLAHFVDPDNGKVPNYGTNDGANVLPLSCSDYTDFRPTLQAASELFCSNDLGLAIGPWTEKTLWLTGSLPQSRTQTAHIEVEKEWSAPIGGYFRLRGKNSRIYARATTFLDRPAQCDILHVDLWHRGHNILRDAGSYRYYHADKKLKEYFYSVRAHNAVQVGDHDQMTKGPNFLWFHWPKSHGRFDKHGNLLLEARFNAGFSYVHQRTISCQDDEYLIEDLVADGVPFDIRWRLPPYANWKQNGKSEFVSVIGDELYSIRVQAKAKKISLAESLEASYYGEYVTSPEIHIAKAVGKVVTILGPVSRLSSSSAE